MHLLLATAALAASPDRASELADLGLRHAAMLEWAGVVEEGGGGLAEVAALAEELGYDDVLGRAALAAGPDALPEEPRAAAAYAAGVRVLEAGDLDGARAWFERIGKDPRWARAQYLVAIHFVEQAKLKSAVMTFREVLQFHGASGPEVELLRDLALANVARIYYSLQRFEDAAEFYRMLGEQEPEFASQLALERAWTAFMMGEPRRAERYLRQVRPEDGVPEAEYLALAASIVDAPCDRTLAIFERETPRALAELEPVHQQLVAIVDGAAAGRPGSALAVWDAALGGDAPTGLPAPLLAELRRDRTLRALLLAADAATVDARAAAERGLPEAEALAADARARRQAALAGVLDRVVRQANRLAWLMEQYRTAAAQVDVWRGRDCERGAVGPRR